MDLVFVHQNYWTYHFKSTVLHCGISSNSSCVGKTFQRALPSITRSCRESNCPWPHVSGGNTCWITYQHRCHAFQVKEFTLNPFKFWGTILCAFSGDHRNPGLYQQLRVFLSKSFPLPQWAGTNFIRAPYGLRSPLWMVLSIPTERNSNILRKLCLKQLQRTILGQVGTQFSESARTAIESK